MLMFCGIFVGFCCVYFDRFFRNRLLLFSKYEDFIFFIFTFVFLKAIFYLALLLNKIESLRLLSSKVNRANLINGFTINEAASDIKKAY